MQALGARIPDGLDVSQLSGVMARALLVLALEAREITLTELSQRSGVRDLKSLRLACHQLARSGGPLEMEVGPHGRQSWKLAAAPDETVQEGGNGMNTAGGANDGERPRSGPGLGELFRRLARLAGRLKSAISGKFFLLLLWIMAIVAVIPKHQVALEITRGQGTSLAHGFCALSSGVAQAFRRADFVHDSTLRAGLREVEVRGLSGGDSLSIPVGSRQVVFGDEAVFSSTGDQAVTRIEGHSGLPGFP